MGGAPRTSIFWAFLIPLEFPNIEAEILARVSADWVLPNNGLFSPFLLAEPFSLEYNIQQGYNLLPISSDR